MPSVTVDLGFKPRPWQAKSLAALKRFSVLIVHRRGGKTIGAVLKLIDAGLKCPLPRGQYAYIAPELKQAKGVAWDYLKHYALKIPGCRANESELWIELPNGSRIQLFGADAPDSLRGRYFDGVVLDEVAQMKPYVWGEILVPALADRKGWCLFIGTPKGINLLSEIYFKAEADPEWYAERFTINDTGALNETELAVMRANMTDQQWRQEMLCDFDASSDETLISIDQVRSALGKHHPVSVYQHSPKVIGVDVALGGGDLTVIQVRQGLAAFPPNPQDLSDPGRIADIVARTIDVHEPGAVFIDNSGGYGSGVVSRLTQLNYACIPVQFGERAIGNGYVNRRTEMWWQMKLWIESGGALPNDQQYLIDLTGPRYDYKNARGLLALETKDQMKSRGIKSPDYGDALSLTFASPVAARPVALPNHYGVTSHQLGHYSFDTPFAPAANRHVHDYSPTDRYAEENS